MDHNDVSTTHVEGVASSVKVKLSSGLLVSGDSKDGDLRSVLRDESSSVSRSREDKDGTGSLLVRGGNGSNGESLGSLSGSGSKVSEVVEQRLDSARDDVISW